MISNEFPFDSKKRCKKELYHKIVYDKINYPNCMDEKDKILLKKILKKEGHERATFKEIITFIECII